MHKQLITPPAIKAKARALLALLDGLSFFEAGYALDEAQILLGRARDRLDEQIFSSCPACAPTGEGDRPVVAERLTQRGQGLDAEFAVNVDELGLSFGAPVNADRRLIHLHWQAFEAARLLRVEPCLDTQLRDAQELLPAMQRWSKSSRLRSHVGNVVVLACSEASTPQAAIELAERVFSFLLTDEAAPPAVGER